MSHRHDDKLCFAGMSTVPQGTGVLLDTCVYIDTAADRLPDHVAELLAYRLSSHSSVCIGELAFGLGALRPEDSRSRANSALIADILRRIAGSGRILDPDAETWTIAGMLAGMVARLQGYVEDRRRKAFADALVLVTARKAGLTLLTANLAEFDPLQQLLPDANVAFYRCT